MSARKVISFVFIVLFILILFYVKNPHINSMGVISRVDGEVYRVVGSYEEHQRAADYLAMLNAKHIKFLRYLKNKYENADPNLKTTKTVNNLLYNYNSEVIYENDPKTSKDTAYTLDKGKALYVCLRKRGNETEFHKPDIVEFILLHELSHMGSTTWGHQDEFWEVFKFILHEAKLSGMYEIVNYKNAHRDYCGLHVDYNPYFDPTVKSIWIGRHEEFTPAIKANWKRRRQLHLEGIHCTR